MKKIVYLLMFIVTYTLYANSSRQYCLSCHDNIFELSRVYTKKQWHNVTSKHNNTLKKLHKNYPDVLKYLHSSKYHPLEIDKAFSFYAYKTKGMKALPKTCYKCHEGEIKMAHLWSKEKWLKLNNSVSSLVSVHKDYPKVLSDIQSKVFQNALAEIVDNMTFFANSEKELKSHREKKQVLKFCKRCHNMNFFTEHWTKKEWRTLASSLKPLKSVHKTNPEVVKYINSNIFHRNKERFIKDILFRSHESLAKDMELTKSKITLYYKKRYVTRQEMEEIFNLLYDEFSKCKNLKPIRFELKPIQEDGGASMLLTMMSFGLIPSSGSTTWQLDTQYRGKIYRVKMIERYYHGIGSKTSDSRKNTVKKLIELLQNKMKKRCLNKAGVKK